MDLTMARNENLNKLDKSSLVLMLGSWSLIRDIENQFRGFSLPMCAKFENNPSSTLWVVAFTPFIWQAAAGDFEHFVKSWREYHRYCRTTLSIMSLGWRSAIQCNWLRWSNWDRTADLTASCVCSATKMLNIKHPYQLHPYERSGDCAESNQLHFIIM